MISLSEEIKARAYHLGFCQIGITRAECLEREGSLLAEWLARGYHGTMEWMVRNLDKRVDPRNIVPEAKSVIAVAVNYFTDVQHSHDEQVGKISRYAWGDDYHDIVKEKLQQLLEFIKSREGTAEGKVYVDTGPVLDKIWAQRAGIGWEGKHTNVITRDYGSWVFLGEIILNLELEYDVPAADHCGSCTLCIEACPTQAIIEPYVLDANRCISYLTIEHRGEIAAELGEKFGRWIYGCDICQDVCPWNKKFAKPTGIQEFSPREYTVAPKLEEWEMMTQDEFSQKFHKSAMKRTKHSGLMRNMQVVMQNEKLKTQN